MNTHTKLKTPTQLYVSDVQDQVETALMGDLSHLDWFRVLDDDQKCRLNDVLRAEAVEQLKLDDVILLRLMGQVTTYEILLERQTGEMIKRHNWAQGLYKGH